VSFAEKSRGLPARAMPSVKKVCFIPKYHLGRYARWTGLAGTLKIAVYRFEIILLKPDTNLDCCGSDFWSEAQRGAE